MKRQREVKSWKKEMKKGKKSKYIMYMQNLKAQDQIIELEIEKKK